MANELFNQNNEDTTLIPLNVSLGNDGISRINLDELASHNFDGYIPSTTASLAASSVTIGMKAQLISGNDSFYTVFDSYSGNPENITSSPYYITYNNGSELVTSSYLYNTLINTRSESWDDKSLGTNGWILTSAGNAIFTNVAARGRIEAKEGTFEGDVEVLDNGNIFIGDPATTGITIASAGIYAKMNGQETLSWPITGASPRILQTQISKSTFVVGDEAATTKIVIAPRFNPTTGSAAIYTVNSGGSTTYTSGSGFYVDEYARFKLAGNSGSLLFDGNNLTVTGTIYATAGSFSGLISASTGSIGGWTISSGGLTGTSASLASSGSLVLGSGNSTVVLSSTDTNSRLWIGNSASGSAPFRVSTTGSLTATNASISGSIIATTGSFTGSVTAQNITATTGSIAGFALSNNSFTAGATTSAVGVTTTSVAFYAGNNNPSSAPFRVLQNGQIIATNASISGSITATSGSFTGSVTAQNISANVGTVGGWTLNSTGLTGTSASLASSGSLVLGSGTDIAIISAVDANSRLWIGNSASASAPFVVSKTGALTATNASISGSINATSGSFSGTVSANAGQIGGWTISSSSIYDGNIVLDGLNQKIYVGNSASNLANFYTDSTGKFAVGANKLSWDGTTLAAQGNITANTLTANSSGSIAGWDITSTELSKGTGPSKIALNSANSQIYIGTGNFGSTDTAFYVASTGQFSLKDQLEFTPNSVNGQDFSELTISGKIRGAIENVSPVPTNKLSISITAASVLTATTASLVTSGSTLFAVGEYILVEGLTGGASVGNGVASVTSMSSSTLGINITGGTVGNYGGQTGSASLRELTMGLHPQQTAPTSASHNSGIGIKLDKYNWWFTNNQWRIGNVSTYLNWNGSTFRLQGGGTKQIQLNVGADDATNNIAIVNSSVTTPTYNNINTPFYVDGTGSFSLSNKLTFDGTNLTASGTIYANSGSFSGSVNAQLISANTGSIGGFTLSANSLTAGNTSSGVGVSTGTYAFWAGSVTNSIAPFRVTNSGSLVATNASITGSVNAQQISANVGTIAGFTLSNNSLTAGATTSAVGVSTGAVAFWAGDPTSTVAPFRVYQNGLLMATNASISGSINATYGSFSGSVNAASISANVGQVGGWTLSTGGLTGSSVTLASSGSLVLGSGADIAIISAADANSRLWIGNSSSATAPFRVSKTGVLTASGATITGTIYANAGSFSGLISASSGSIAGFTLSNSSLTAGATTSAVGVTTTSVAFYAGNNNPSSAPFRVLQNGQIIATNASISGSITATGGSFTGSVSAQNISASTGNIAGFTLSSNSLTAGASSSAIGVSTGTYAFWAGGTNAATAPFNITQTGSLIVSDITINAAGSGNFEINNTTASIKTTYLPELSGSPSGLGFITKGTYGQVYSYPIAIQAYQNTQTSVSDFSSNDGNSTIKINSPWIFTSGSVANNTADKGLSTLYLTTPGSSSVTTDPAAKSYGFVLDSPWNGAVQVGAHGIDPNGIYLRGFGKRDQSPWAGYSRGYGSSSQYYNEELILGMHIVNGRGRRLDLGNRSSSVNSNSTTASISSSVGIFVGQEFLFNCGGELPETSRTIVSVNATTPPTLTLDSLIRNDLYYIKKIIIPNATTASIYLQYTGGHNLVNGTAVTIADTGSANINGNRTVTASGIDYLVVSITGGVTGSYDPAAAGANVFFNGTRSNSSSFVQGRWMNIESSSGIFIQAQSHIAMAAGDYVFGTPEGGRIEIDKDNGVTIEALNSGRVNISSSGSGGVWWSGTSSVASAGITSPRTIIRDGYIWVARDHASEPTIYSQTTTYGNGKDHIRFYNGSVLGGMIQAGSAANVILYTSLSDYRLKNKKDLIFDDDLITKTLMELKPRWYTWKNDSSSTTHLGFFAHEVQQVVPEAVAGKRDEIYNNGEPRYQGIDYSKLLPLVIATIQNQQKTISKLEQKIQYLELKIHESLDDYI